MFSLPAFVFGVALSKLVRYFYKGEGWWMSIIILTILTLLSFGDALNMSKHAKFPIDDLICHIFILTMIKYGYETSTDFEKMISDFKKMIL